MMKLMQEAGLNTLLGMGMTFLVLILLSCIITVFGKLITAFQNRGSSAPVSRQGTLSGSEPEEISADVPAEDTSVRGINENDELIAVLAAAVAAFESESLSPEIVAVITAAVTAYEGTGSGYVVRKIRKSRRHVA